jgi:GntR family transcriptional repressor for pyruvate dehydrogenase complex
VTIFVSMQRSDMYGRAMLMGRGNARALRVDSSVFCILVWMPRSEDKRSGSGDVASLAVARIRPAYQQVADQLREQIVTGILRPGDRLPVEGELASVFGVSRSTVREALRALASQGFTYTKRGVAGGTFISRSDPDSIREAIETRIALLAGEDEMGFAELLEMRQLLEVPAARFAAVRRTPEQLDAMRSAIENEKADPLARAGRFAAQRPFHEIVFEASGNRLLTVLGALFLGVLRVRATQYPFSRAVLDLIDHDHVELLELIEARDADRAGEAMEDHITRLNAIFTYSEDTNTG